MADSQMSLEQQEQVLEDNRDFIVKRLDADDVIDELIQAKLIGQNARQRIELMGTSRIEKNRIIFDQLITCGPGALVKFCEILRRKKRQSFIAEQLEKCEYSEQCEQCHMILYVCHVIMCANTEGSGVNVINVNLICNYIVVTYIVVAFP